MPGIIKNDLLHLTQQVNYSMKFSVRPQFARLQGVIEAIRRGTLSGGYPNCSTFMSRFRVSRFTVLRDIGFLRDEWGAPIEYDASTKGYYLSDPAWTVPAVKLDRREVFALGIARKVMAAFRGTPLEADMQAALARMTESLEGHISMEPASMTEHLSVLTEDYAPQDPEIWLAAARFAHRRERVRMRYRKFDGALRDYDVEPNATPAAMEVKLSPTFDLVYIPAIQFELTLPLSIFSEFSCLYLPSPSLPVYRRCGRFRRGVLIG